MLTWRRVAPPGSAVTALIPQDYACVGRQVLLLVMPDLLAERVTVAEDDRDRRIRWPEDLGVQPHAVIGNDVDRTPSQLPERLVSGWIRPQPDAADGHLLGRDDSAGGCRRDTCYQASDAR